MHSVRLHHCTMPLLIFSKIKLSSMDPTKMLKLPFFGAKILAVVDRQYRGLPCMYSIIVCVIYTGRRDIIILISNSKNRFLQLNVKE